MRKYRVPLFVLMAVALIGGYAGAANLSVLVAPDDSEWIHTIEEYGFVPATDMVEFLAAYDPNACAVGIAYSGIDLLDQEWLDEFIVTGATVVAFGWDIDDLFYAEDGVEPSYDPDLTTIAYSFDGMPITYPVASARELSEVLTFACFYAEDWSNFGSLGFGFDDMDFEAMLEEILEEAGPFLAILDKFLQPEWEYHWAPLTSVDNLIDHMNELGAAGWEFITFLDGGMLFKRRALNAERLIELIFLMTQEALEMAEEQGVFF